MRWKFLWLHAHAMYIYPIIQFFPPEAQNKGCRIWIYRYTSLLVHKPTSEKKKNNKRGGGRETQHCTQSVIFTWQQLWSGTHFSCLNTQNRALETVYVEFWRGPNAEGKPVCGSQTVRVHIFHVNVLAGFEKHAWCPSSLPAVSSRGLARSSYGTCPQQ